MSSVASPTRSRPGGAARSRGQTADKAQASAKKACSAWRAISRQWDQISTARDTSALTPMATEIDDLVLRTGRLAYHDHLWTPEFAAASRGAHQPSSPPPSPTSPPSSAPSITPATPSA